MSSHNQAQMQRPLHTNAFLEDALAQVPRLLGQMNRNPGSRTYGSFDRAFWHYRTNDVSACRYQEAVYTLALLYVTPCNGNVYYKDAVMYEWICAALQYTRTLQRQNGSFDEWYLNEGSFVGTAFLTAALCQTLMLLRAHGVAMREEIAMQETLLRAAHFLAAYDEHTVLNQVSGAVFAVAGVGVWCDDSALRTRADVLLDHFLSKQSSEGWWSEYGGPDIGYLSLTISYLSKYEALTGSKKVQEPIARARAFIDACIHPDRTAGGEYMARNTEYLIPSHALPYYGALGPMHLDDRYLCYILYNWIETGRDTQPVTPVVRTQDRYFAESGLYVVSKDETYFIANGQKGGAFRLYGGGGIYYDSGVEVRLGAHVYTTGVLNAHTVVSCDSGVLECHGYTSLIREPLMYTPIMVLFKLWQLVCGRFTWMQRSLKKFLRVRMVSYAGKGGIPFTRRITIDSEKLTVVDTLYAQVDPECVRFGDKASYTAVPSAKYVCVPENGSRRYDPQVSIEVGAAQVTIRRVFLLMHN